MNDSDVYVLVDDNEQIVAARRIIYGKGDYSHTACFGSFGVHGDHLRKGYGELFYKLFFEKVERERPDINRIELTQETDNNAALHLANKMGFKIEAIFPDWLPRRTGAEAFTRKWYIGERFHAHLLDADTEKQSITFIPFMPQLPLLKAEKSLNKFEETNGKIDCYSDNKLVATCKLDAGVRRYAHIQFWTVEPEPDCDHYILQNILRDLAVLSSKEYKKIEILVSNQVILDTTATLGFHYRGQKIASRKVNGIYYNEVGVDLSFFDTLDAKVMLKTIENKDDFKIAKVSSVLTNCRTKIEEAYEKNQIDLYGKLYLENFAFQMTREGLGETRLYDETNAPFNNLITQMPEPLKTVFINLASTINPKFIIDVSNNNDLNHNSSLVNRNIT